MQSAQVHHGMFLNLKEFGLDLFDAIKLCGSVEQLRVLREQSKMKHVKPGQLTEWQNRERDCINQLLEIIPKLNDQDAADLLRRYKWIADH